MKNMLFILCAVLANPALSKSPSRKLASIKQADRVEHARELLGDRYRKSTVKSHEKHVALEQSILAAVKHHLPRKHSHRAHDVAHAIITEAGKHSLDPFFVMAVIAGESSFNPEARGPVGEIGLMQLRPATAKWIAKIAKQKWKGNDSLKDPVTNIRLGTSYIAWLRKKFDNQGQLYLAAYNMGPRNVKKALSKSVRPKDYPNHVMKRYLAFYKNIAVAKI